MMMMIMMTILTLTLPLPLAAALTLRLRRWGRGIEEALPFLILHHHLPLLIKLMRMKPLL